jgi:hypothetical protein
MLVSPGVVVLHLLLMCGHVFSHTAHEFNVLQRTLHFQFYKRSPVKLIQYVKVDPEEAHETKE